MDPITIALIFQALDMAIKLAPEVITLVEQIKAAVCKNPDVVLSLKMITTGTIKASETTMEILAPLLKGTA